MGSWLLNLIQDRCVASFDPFDIQNTLKLFNQSLQEAHKEYNSLTDQIWAMCEQLDSGEFGTVDTPAFKAEACELENLLAHVSQLCQKLNLPPPKELYRPEVFKH